mmetsp:Transcript_43877/g.126849  ORF Transcript_43877/g.126849 Transcript_43877/m.126849 type:complete len:327 (-) Transcript_43877:465-1445(-)
MLAKDVAAAGHDLPSPEARSAPQVGHQIGPIAVDTAQVQHHRRRRGLSREQPQQRLRRSCTDAAYDNDPGPRGQPCRGAPPPLQVPPSSTWSQACAIDCWLLLLLSDEHIDALERQPLPQQTAHSGAEAVQVRARGGECGHEALRQGRPLALELRDGCILRPPRQETHERHLPAGCWLPRAVLVAPQEPPAIELPALDPWLVELGAEGWKEDAALDAASLVCRVPPEGRAAVSRAAWLSALAASGTGVVAPHVLCQDTLQAMLWQWGPKEDDDGLRILLEAQRELQRLRRAALCTALAEDDVEAVSPAASPHHGMARQFNMPATQL